MIAKKEIKSTPNKRIERSALTRTTRTNERLLMATLQVVSSLGLDAVTMSEVANRAGITRRTLYRHYAHKEALLEALFLFVRGRFEEQFRQAIAKNPAPEERMEVISRFTVEALNQAPSRAVWRKEARLMLGFFNENKLSSITLMEWALEPLFDHAEKTQKIKLNRSLIAEIATRVAASIYVMPWQTNNSNEANIIEAVLLAHLYGTRTTLAVEANNAGANPSAIA